MAFTHRNGETEAPTVLGRYLFIGDLDERFVGVKTLTVVIASNDGLLAWHEYHSCYTDISTLKGEWWGPIIKVRAE